MTITFNEAVRAVYELGFDLNKRDGEYRLSDQRLPIAKREDSAYYSDDLVDVICTAVAWREFRDAKPQ